MKATYVEIYNEQLRDLLIPESTPLHERPQVSIREDTKGRILPTGLTQVPINSVDDLLQALRFGSAIRQTDSTAINAQSSRSHAVFSLNLVQKKKATSQPPRDKRLSVPIETLTTSEATVTIDSKLHFVDLAGSERLKNTGAQGDRAKEGISINAGLASLGKVISQLSSRPGSHVSYRDSRLTRLLQDSLGGNAITYMVACVTPAEFHLSETLNTVTYAQRARAIQSKPEIQQTSDDADKVQVERLRAEVAFLREQIKHERNDQQHLSPTSDRPGSRRKEVELQNKLMDIQESYNALSQRHAKLIAEIARARDNEDDALGENAYERMKQSNSMSEAVEQTVMEYEKTIQSLESSLANTKSTLSNNESTLMERESKIAYMENLAQQLQGRLQKLTDREANNDGYLRELETQIEGATSSEEKSSSLITSLRKELSRVKDSENTAEEYITTLEERLAEAEQDQEIMQREMDRLEHVIERQRSIGRLDNLLAELDTIRQADPTSNLKGTSSDIHEKKTVDVLHGSDSTVLEKQSTTDEYDLAKNPESTAGSVATAENVLEDNAAGLAPHQDTSKTAPVEAHEQNAAQSTFMADKLETITQELFELRGEHESTVTDYDELQRKYDIALQTLAKLQDSTGDDSPTSRESGDAENFFTDAGVGGMEDGRLNPFSRSLESELSLRRESLISLTDENMDTEGTKTMVAGDGAADLTGTAQPEDRNSDPARNSNHLQELETLRRSHAEREASLVELSAMFAALQQQHQNTLRQVEDLKTEAPRSPSKLRPNSPSSPAFMKPSIRRKPSQDMIGTMTNTDKTTRSFATLKNIALDNFESNPDARQNFQLHLDSIMTEMHNRSERVQALDEEVAAARRDMESKMAIINGLTRERSSLSSSTNLDFTVVSRMQDQLMESEHQVRALQEAHVTKAEELSASESRHDRAVESAKASETTFLATIAALEASKAESAASLAKQQASHEERVVSLNKQIEVHRDANQEYIGKINQLEQSHAKFLQQADVDGKSRELTERELRSHRNLVNELKNQIENHNSTIANHKSMLDSLETVHAEEMENIRAYMADADMQYAEKTAALEQRHKNELANVRSELKRAKEDIEELLKDTSDLVGQETHLGNFHSHLSNVISRSRGLEDDHVETANDHQATKDELLAAQAKVTNLESRIGELMVLHEEMQRKLAAVSEKERKSSHLVAELEEQLNSTYDTHQDTTTRLSAMQNERQMQLDEAWHAKSELEKEMEDARSKISTLEVSLVYIVVCTA